MRAMPVLSKAAIGFAFLGVFCITAFVADAVFGGVGAVLLLP